MTAKAEKTPLSITKTPPRRRQRRAIAAFAVLSVTAAGIYGAFAATAPLPPLHPLQTTEPAKHIPGSALKLQQLLDSMPQPTAVGYLSDPQIHANSGAKHPIASITKLITALVCLEHTALTGSDLTHTFTAADEILTAEIASQDGVVAPTPPGTNITAEELLAVTLLASANNYAVIYSRLVFGSDNEFLTAARSWLSSNGLGEIEIVDAHGLSPANRASPADLVRLGQIALKNPTVAEIVRKQEITLTGLGTFANTNPLRTNPHNRGLKTGTLDEGQYNLLGAATTAHGTPVAITAVLARPDAQARKTDSEILLSALLTDSTDTLVNAGEIFAEVTTWQGETVQAVTAAALTAPLRANDQATVSVTLQKVQRELPASSPLGSVSVRTAPPGSGTQNALDTADTSGSKSSVQLVTLQPITPPDFWWRISHPGAVFSWWLEFAAAVSA